jgi:uncharacterized membrane protein
VLSLFLKAGREDKDIERRYMGEERHRILFRDDPHFRWRSTGVSRLEAFSDAVFAFAITLLIVTLEVPRSFEALMETLSGFFAFGAAFVFISFIWYQHYLYFRRYGLEHFRIVVLNLALLFLMLFFVYPFKFLASIIINGVFLNGVFGFSIPLGIDPGGITEMQYPVLFTIYGLGFSAIFMLFGLLYREVERVQEALQLNLAEQLETLKTVRSMLVLAMMPVLAIPLVWFLPLKVGGWISGLALAMIAPVIFLVDFLTVRRFRQKYGDPFDTARSEPCASEPSDTAA